MFPLSLAAFFLFAPQGSLSMINFPFLLVFLSARGFVCAASVCVLLAGSAPAPVPRLRRSVRQRSSSSSSSCHRRCPLRYPPRPWALLPTAARGWISPAGPRRPARPNTLRCCGRLLQFPSAPMSTLDANSAVLACCCRCSVPIDFHVGARHSALGFSPGL